MCSSDLQFLDEIKFNYAEAKNERKIYDTLIRQILLVCASDKSAKEIASAKKELTSDQELYINNIQSILNLLYNLDLTKLSTSPEKLALEMQPTLALMAAPELITPEQEQELRINIKKLIRYYNKLVDLFNNIYESQREFYVNMNKLLPDKYEKLESMKIKEISDNIVDNIPTPAKDNNLISLIYLGQELVKLTRQLNTQIKDFISEYSKYKVEVPKLN